VADFSHSGVESLPQATAETLAKGDPRVLGWLAEAVAEGDRINHADPSYDQIEPAMRYIVGEQLSADRRKLKYLPQVVINESRKATQAHVSALTDLKPLGGWRSINPAYRQAADMLNLYAVAEWVTLLADIELGDVVKYSLAAGTGDLVVDWDPHAAFGGAHSYRASDPRDTLPFRPTSGRSVQLWQGVILREGHTVNALRAKYPTRASLFQASTDSAVASIMGRFRTVAAKLLTPADPLDQLGANAVHTRVPRGGQIVVHRAHFKDHTRNLTTTAIVMGDPAANWSYVVQPNDPLYPRGRCVVATDTVIIYDGPNP
jgi:hypothetical protein